MTHSDSIMDLRDLQKAAALSGSSEGSDESKA